MSTAYPPRFVRYMFSSMKERDRARTSVMTPGFYGDIPSKFGLYYSSPGEDFLSQRFHIATMPTEEAGPRALYAVTFHKGPGLLQMTIYSTPEHGTAPMAISRLEQLYGSSVTIKLPPSAEGAYETGTEKLKYNGFGRSKTWSTQTNSYSFSLNGETFEWQDSRTKPKVRRLVRLGSENRTVSGVMPGDSEDEVRDYEIELVATMTEGTVPTREGRLAIFEFPIRKTGRTAAQDLGEYWALLAVSTAFAVCQQGVAIEGTSAWYEEKKLEKNWGDDKEPTDEGSTPAPKKPYMRTITFSDGSTYGPGYKGPRGARG